MNKRVLSMLLVLVMLLGIVPTGVLATEAMTLTVGANLPEANATFRVVDYKNHDDSNNATSAVIHIPATDGDVAPISMEAQLINYDKQNYTFTGWKIAAGGKEFTGLTFKSAELMAAFEGVFSGAYANYTFGNASKVDLDLKTNANIEITAMFESNQPPAPHLKITSNVTDETVKVFTSPEVAMGGETIDMEYDGGRKDIKAVPNFFIGTEEYAFSHYVVNGMTYQPAAGTVNVTDVDGFEGTIRYYYATAPQITVFAGTMSKDMEVQFVYEKLEPTFHQITVTSNVWDSSVEVLDTPTSVMGGQTFPLSYRGKELELHAKKYVTVEGQKCAFSHFLVNGVRYEAGNNPQNITDVAGFDGTLVIFTNSASYRGMRLLRQPEPSFSVCGWYPNSQNTA